jgi:hypothetical protein
MHFRSALKPEAEISFSQVKILEGHRLPRPEPLDLIDQVIGTGTGNMFVYVHSWTLSSPQFNPFLLPGKCKIHIPKKHLPWLSENFYGVDGQAVLQFEWGNWSEDYAEQSELPQ